MSEGNNRNGVRIPPPPSTASGTPWAGDLEFTIECRTDGTVASGVPHPITIRGAWSVITPHDLEAERVARAFGGHASCLQLVELTIPRLREGLGRISRRTRPPLRQDKRRQWRVPSEELIGCCRNRAFRSIRTATEHLRSPAHLATLLRLPLWQVAEIVGHVDRACLPDTSAASPCARYVREDDGLKQLWQSGIHTELVPQLAAYASVVDQPLPASYFEGVVYSGHRPDWLNGVLEHRPDPDTAAWLAWQTPPDVLSDAREWGLWLGYGLSRRDFAVAVEHMLPASSVITIAEQTGWPVRTAARVLVAFAKADCRPTPKQLTAIARLGLEHAIPGKATVDVAAEDVLSAGIPVDRTELSLMLAVVGNRPMVLAAVRRGARTVSDLDPVRPL